MLVIRNSKLLQHGELNAIALFSTWTLTNTQQRMGGVDDLSLDLSLFLSLKEMKIYRSHIIVRTRNFSELIYSFPPNSRRAQTITK